MARYVCLSRSINTKKFSLSHLGIRNGIIQSGRHFAKHVREDGVKVVVLELLPNDVGVERIGSVLTDGMFRLENLRGVYMRLALMFLS